MSLALSTSSSLNLMCTIHLPPLLFEMSPVTSRCLKFSNTLALACWLLGPLYLNLAGHSRQFMVTSYDCSRKAPCPGDAKC